MFEFTGPGRIVFGPGSRTRLVELAQGLGKRPLVVRGRPRQDTQQLLEGLEQAFGACPQIQVCKEPELPALLKAIEDVRPAACDFVIAIGGGSVLDFAKALAALLNNPGPVHDYLEVVGKGLPLRNPALPSIAVPTTAGTGAEATKNAVLADPERGVKVSLRHPSLLPRVAVVDSQLTWSVPRDVTAATGLDALTQVLEPYVCRQVNPLTDALCQTGLTRVGRALRRVVHDPRDGEARNDMALVSLCGGLALANAKLGAVHGFAAPLGGRYDAPHGALCARLLPLVFSANLRALRASDPDGEAVARFTRVARWLTEDPQASAEQGAAWLQALCSELEVPPLGHWGVKAADLSELAASAARASSMQGNPVSFEHSELVELLERAL